MSFSDTVWLSPNLDFLREIELAMIQASIRHSLRPTKTLKASILGTLRQLWPLGFHQNCFFERSRSFEGLNFLRENAGSFSAQIFTNFVNSLRSTNELFQERLNGSAKLRENAGSFLGPNLHNYFVKSQVWRPVHKHLKFFTNFIFRSLGHQIVRHSRFRSREEHWRHVCFLWNLVIETFWPLGSLPAKTFVTEFEFILLWFLFRIWSSQIRSDKIIV